MTRKPFMTHAAFLAAACVLALSACQQSSLMNASESSTSTSANSSVHYVSTTGSNSTGNGSKASPWATIAYASTQVGAGATVYVAAGEYKGSFSTSASGSSSAYISYIAAAADFSAPVNCAQVAAAHGDLNTCARLVGSSGTTWSNMGNYVVIQGFDVSGPGLNGIYTQGTYTQISGNHVHDVLTSTCNGTGGSGINLNGTNPEVVGNYVHNIGPYPSTCGYVQGIYFLQAGGYAYNNISFNNSGFGIQLWHYPSNIAIYNNTIFNNASGGIVLGTDDSITVDYITVANNIVVNNNGPGVSEQGNSSTSTGKHNVYTNNLVEGNSGGSFSLQNGLTAVLTLSAGPQFLNYTGNASGDYHLLSTSPALGAGTASGAPTSDFDGNSRPTGGPIDIGAYQDPPSGGSTTTTTTATNLPVMGISPASLSFPTTRHGSTSSIEYATVSNSGTGNLQFSGNFTISGPFAFGGVGTCGVTVAPNTSCTVSVVFTPTSSGQFTGAVTLADNFGTGSQQIALSGKGK